jgi:hypothetical protein
MKSEKGSILFLVVIFSVVLSIIGMAVIYLSGWQLILANQNFDRMQAMNSADAGLESAKAWIAVQIPHCFLENRSGHSGDRNAFDPFGGQQLIGRTPDGSKYFYYAVTIAPSSTNNVGSIPPGKTSTFSGDNVLNLNDGLGGGPPHPWGGMGEYVISSTGTITTNVHGSIDIVKLENVKIRITDAGGTFQYTTVPNSWLEQPVRRVVHP